MFVSLDRRRHFLWHHAAEGPLSLATGRCATSFTAISQLCEFTLDRFSLPDAYELSARRSRSALQEGTLQILLLSKYRFERGFPVRASFFRRGAMSRKGNDRDYEGQLS